MKENKDIWNKIFSSRDWGQYPAEDLVRFISNNFGKSKLKKKKIILEIGCGPGGNLNYLSKEGFIIHGIDFSKKAINIAKKNLKKNHQNWKGKLIIGDITKYHYKEKYFDAIIDNEVSCCLPINQVIALYKKLSYSLKKNGKIFLRTFSNKSYGFNTGKKIGYNLYLPKVGAVKMGPQRFSSSRDIDKIFKNNYKILKKEIISRTIHNRKDLISEWIVEAIKKDV